MISLNGGNWMIWKPRTKDLCYKDLYTSLKSDDAKTKDMFDGEQMKLNCKVVEFIQQWLDDSIFHHVSIKILAHSL